MDDLHHAIQRAKWCPKTNGHRPQPKSEPPKPEPVAQDGRIYELERRIRRLEEKLSNPDKVVDIKARLNIAGIKRVVCDFYAITEEELISDQRHQDIMRPRFIAIYIACKKLTAYNLAMIGKHFGNRDRTTILHARKVISERRLVEPDLDAVIIELEGKLEPFNAS